MIVEKPSLKSECLELNGSDEIPVNHLKPKQCGIIRRIIQVEDDMDRLMSMGVCKNRIVELVQCGDPLILKVYGTRIGISQRLADRILVEPCSTRACHAENHV